ncbi:MAG: FAD-dependent oxidoreductase [Armatimonadetes bacterium]|nr:FAD-dependent oxidoreductase [Armatimonadota bacterium]MDE2205049.1 FAD-dependent oxidoreductase [Armatimonadota bacterium]
MEHRVQNLIIGGGLAGCWAAQNLRTFDTESSTAIVCGEPHPPYDRPPISKNLLTNPDMTADDCYSKFDDYYPKNNIQLLMGQPVTSLDTGARSARLANGDTIAFAKALLATGARARPLSVPGSSRPGVWTLRTVDDGLGLREALAAANTVAICGAGFIGMEVAGGLAGRGKRVTVIEPSPAPWGRLAGAAIGGYLASLLSSNGIEALFGDEPAAFDGATENGAVTHVRTKGGKRIEAEVVLAAVGATLNLDLAVGAGLAKDGDDGVTVDQSLQTRVPGIFVAGDIALYPDQALQRTVRHEHFLNAKWQGQTAGANMAGQNQPFRRVPYFFSDLFDVHAALRGDPGYAAGAIVTGDLHGGEFTELRHSGDGTLVAGLVVSHDGDRMDAIADALERQIEQRVNIAARSAEIAAPGFDVVSLG